ncbi:alpha/beta-type small acid-soluble spore protein [Proteinivorax hydrogeniformans]|uniref:Alpha/beta-type small acid-soluble spore protein n=1 Tax=Proteinivorax hydrogeniformans TaxID=1826727 RepID=A0AAU8HWT1_9FIRM
MAARRRRRSILPEEVLDQFKYEVADQLGLKQKIENVGWGNMSSYECGKIGGRIGGAMVKSIIRDAQKQMMEKGEL